jgi:hypothetical protein
MELQASSPCLQDSTTNLYLQSREYSHYYNYFCYYCHRYYSVIVFVFLVNFFTFVHFPSRNSLPTSHIVSLINFYFSSLYPSGSSLILSYFLLGTTTSLPSVPYSAYIMCEDLTADVFNCRPFLHHACPHKMLFD